MIQANKQIPEIGDSLDNILNQVPWDTHTRSSFHINEILNIDQIDSNHELIQLSKQLFELSLEKIKNSSHNIKTILIIPLTSSHEDIQLTPPENYENLLQELDTFEPPSLAFISRNHDHFFTYKDGYSKSISLLYEQNQAKNLFETYKSFRGADHADYVRCLYVEHYPDPYLKGPAIQERKPTFDAFYFAKQGNLKEIIKSLETGTPINTTDEDGHTLLHWAASEGHIETAKYLVENGLTLGATTEFGLTPFHIAVSNGHTELVAYFISKGADVNAMCQANNNFALHNAAFGNHLKTVDLLIQHGANPNALDDENHTPLTEAALSGNLDIATLLINSGASIELAKKNGLSKQDLTGKSKSEMAKLLAL